MIVLDTHALLWWALDPERLSETAMEVVQRMERDGGYASSVSVWELGIKLKRGKLEMGIGIEEFAARIERGGTVELVPVDTTLWLQSLALDWEHRDPADRVIVSTALLKGVPLLTCDSTIRDFGGVDTLW